MNGNMNRFSKGSLRVRLQFEDEEKYWLFVDLSRVKTVQDVIDDINCKYSIECDKLFLDDAQLFSKETVEILQDKDLIRVCVRHAKRKKTKAEDGNANLVETPSFKPKKKKKCKELMEDVIQHTSPELEETPPSPPRVHKKKKHLAEVAVPDPEPLQCDNSTTEPQNQSETTEEVKRRKRRRKRKSNHLQSSPFNDSLVPNDVTPQTCVFFESKTRQHVRFGDDSEVETGLETKPCSLTNGSASLKHSGLIKNGLEPIIPAEPKIQPAAPKLGSLLSLRSAVFTRNPMEIDTTKSYNNVPPPSLVTSSPKVPLKDTRDLHQIDVTKYPIFSGPPRLNDLIAFKVLELSDDYSPEISEYMQGRITMADPNGDLTIQLLNPRVKRHARGKFELIENEEELGEEEEMVDEYESTVTYNWNQMIEPRLIFP